MDDRGSERETAEATIVLQDSESPSASVQYKSSADSPGDEATGAGGSCEVDATVVAYVRPQPHNYIARCGLVTQASASTMPSSGCRC